MIHLTKVKTGYMVATLADNGEVLATSEILKTKRSAWMNIYSQANGFDYQTFLVQDDTAKPKPMVYTLEEFKKPYKQPKFKPHKKYSPAKTRK